MNIESGVVILYRRLAADHGGGGLDHGYGF